MEKSNEPLITFASLKNSEEPYSGGTPSGSFGSVRIERMLAYAVDVVCIFLIGIAASAVAVLMGIITLGLLSPILAVALAMVPLAYHTLTIGSEWHATIGMRLFNLEVRRNNGEYPDYATAFIHAALFYVTMAVTSSLILLVSLFNPQGKLLHDYLTDSIVRPKANL